MNGKQRIGKWLWFFSIGAALVVVYKTYTGLDGVLGLFGKIVDIFAPFVGGFVLAFFLYQPCKWLEGCFLTIQGRVWPKLARPLALIITYTVFLGILSMLFYLVIPILVDSLSKLIGELPNLLKESQATVNRWIAPDGPLGGLELQDKVDEIYANLKIGRAHV